MIKTKSIIATISLAAAVSLCAEDKVALTTEIPEAMFEGTKVPLKLANLEPVEVKQKPLMVPKGLTNLALEKEITASDDLPVIGDLEYVTDGDKDAADGSYVELGPQVQWVQIDLEKESEVHGIWLWHFHKNARAYIDVIAQVSNDETFTDSAKITTVYNADHDNSSGMGKGTDKAYVETNKGRVIDGKGAKGRYVRLYSNGNSSNEMNHYIEVEVWGK
ncbi:MAG: discoidin domain-containing protein [Verrucomicrobiales bacterium]